MPNEKDPHLDPNAEDEPIDPQSDSDDAMDRRKGQTTEHAMPPRLEDEGQSGG